MAPSLTHLGCSRRFAFVAAFCLSGLPIDALASPSDSVKGPLVEAPVVGRPSLVVSAPDEDESFAHVDGRWFKLSNGQSIGYAQGTICAAGSMRDLVCLALETKGQGSQAQQSLVVVHKNGLREPVRAIEGRGRLLPLGIAFTSGGVQVVAYQESGTDDSDEPTTYVIEGEQKYKLAGNPFANSGGDSAYAGRLVNPVQFVQVQGHLNAVYRNQGVIYVERVGDLTKPKAVAYSSRYDFFALSTSNGFWYVLYHSEEDMSLHAAVAHDGVNFSDLDIPRAARS